MAALRPCTWARARPTREAVLRVWGRSAASTRRKLCAPSGHYEHAARAVAECVGAWARRCASPTRVHAPRGAVSGQRAITHAVPSTLHRLHAHDRWRQRKPRAGLYPGTHALRHSSASPAMSDRRCCRPLLPPPPAASEPVRCRPTARRGKAHGRIRTRRRWWQQLGKKCTTARATTLAPLACTHATPCTACVCPTAASWTVGCTLAAASAGL